MYRSASLGGVHLKLDGSAVPPPIFVSHPVKEYYQRKKKQHIVNVEVSIYHINIQSFHAQFFQLKIKNYLHLLDIYKKNSETTRKIFLQY